MKRLILALLALILLGYSSEAKALTSEEDSITCNISAATLVLGWNTCSNSPFSDGLGTADTYGQIKFFSTVYSGIGDTFFFNCATSGTIYIDGWEYVSVLGSINPGQYTVVFHVNQISGGGCIGDPVGGANLNVLVMAP